MVFCLSCQTAATTGISALRPLPPTPQAPLLFPASTHVPLSRLVLAATGNCDSGVWLARGLPPPTSGRPGRSQPWRTPRALPPDVHRGPGQGCPPLCRAETPRGFLLVAAVEIRAAAPAMWPSQSCTVVIPTFQGRKLRFREAATFAQVTQQNWSPGDALLAEAVPGWQVQGGRRGGAEALPM